MSRMSKMMSFVYGSVAYTLFLGCLVYAIGFLGDFAVPKSIDSGPVAPLPETLIVNTLLLSLFALQHTGMARKGFKKAWTKVVPEQVERSTYVLFSTLSLLLLYWQWRPMPQVVWSMESTVGQGMMWTLFGAGWIIVLLATMMIHHFDLFWMRQVYMHAKGMPYKDLGFRTPGFYRYMRHPIQVGFMIAFWATPVMTAGHLMFAVVTAAYIVIAVTMFEEPDLTREFGERYRNYMRQVPGFIPMGRYRETKPPTVDAEMPSAMSR